MTSAGTFLVLLALAVLVRGPSGQYGVSPPAATHADARTIPHDCDKPQLLLLGRPHMIPGSHDPQLGLSMTNSQFQAGEPVMLFIWAHNPTDTAVPLSTCSDLESFKARGFDLYDADGHPLVRKREAGLIRLSRRKVDPCQGFPWSCTRNLMLEIAPHTCVNGANYDFSTNLAEQYDLPSGEYTVHPHAYGDTSETACKATHPPFHKDPSIDITFSISAP